MVKSVRQLFSAFPMSGELAKFAVAGVLGFTFDYALLLCFVRGLGISPYIARPIALALAIFATWAVNRAWTFRHHGTSDAAATLPSYYLVQLVGGAINYAIFSFALLTIPALQNILIIPTAFGSVVALVFNFFFCRRVFKTAGYARSGVDAL